MAAEAGVDPSIVSGGHRVAKAPKAEGVDVWRERVAILALPGAWLSRYRDEF